RPAWVVNGRLEGIQPRITRISHSPTRPREPTPCWRFGLCSYPCHPRNPWLNLFWRVAVRAGMVTCLQPLPARRPFVMSRNAPPRVAVLGAGPVGVEAALYAASLKLPVRLYERGDVGNHLRHWGHVKTFTPFAMNTTPLGRAALRADA